MTSLFNKSQFRALAIALSFLTTLPVRYPLAPSAQELQRSIYWYPLVGLIIGVLLWLSSFLLPDSLLGAGLILVLWVILSGALHLDGLADCADAWMGGLSDREKTLRILKDPTAGAIAVVVLILVLGLKLSAISILINNDLAYFLILIPALARTTPILLFATTPYVRSGGIGAHLKIGSDQRLLQYGLYATVILSLLLFVGVSAIWVLLGVAIVFWVIRASSIDRLQGFTGDVAGALIEFAELIACISLALLHSR